MDIDLNFSIGPGKEIYKETFEQFLTRVTDATGIKVLERDYLQPTKQLIFFEILTTKKVNRLIVNIYEPTKKYMDSIIEDPIVITCIIHSHPVGSMCAACFYCHEYTYRPTGQEHPSFIKQFNLKWSYLYE